MKSEKPKIAKSIILAVTAAALDYLISTFFTVIFAFLVGGVAVLIFRENAYEALGLLGDVPQAICASAAFFMAFLLVRFFFSKLCGGPKTESLCFTLFGILLLLAGLSSFAMSVNEGASIWSSIPAVFQFLLGILAIRKAKVLKV